MTAKTRGIRLKDHLDPEDQGQRKLMQVTYAQLRTLGLPARDTPADDIQPQPSTAPQSKTSTPGNARRRAIARMLRVELEATLALLNKALADVAGRGEQGEPAKQPEAKRNG
jgi:hypothetical protein